MLLMLQVNDYVGTLEPQIQMVIRDFSNADGPLSFIAFSSVFKNSVLIFVLINLILQTSLQNGAGIAMDCVYQLMMPIVITVVICVPTTLVIKK